MYILEIVFAAVLFISALLLIILVMIQPDRSHGMSASMGMGGSNTVFGLSRDGGPLAKLTKLTAAIFIISALALYLVRQ
ncbi:preprotein translocase subunit SecG [Fusobacterium sp. PH5-44]|uniref:preprotein translocase subunit SecG n=1 Tax=unclassified Fusobacterium TaxID=2648384 RepID=UPI003D1EFA8D